MQKGANNRSLLFVMAALMISGAAMIPLLTIGLMPAQKTLTMSVGAYWGGASPEIMEREVVSKLEGVMARLSGVEGTSSTSQQGSGSVTVTFKEGTRMDMARFQAASQLRNLYPQLPEGVSYPTLNVSTGGERGGEAMVMGYTINTILDEQIAERFLKENIVPALSKIEGVNGVNYGGFQSYGYEFIVDPDAARVAGVTMNDISTAFNSWFGEATIGSVTHQGNVILLKTRASDRTTDFENIPVANSSGRIVSLGALATMKYRPNLPSSYSRINGLNILNMTVSAQKNVNVMKLSAEIKARMEELKPSFPKGFTTEVNFDAADHIDKELRTILLRTLMTVVILLLFVFAVSRNWVYLLIIFATLLANILVAFIFYKLLNLQIHIYSLAGITVSLGIIIDTSIIMVDHYSYYRDRKAFLSILGAVLTTVASLTVIFLLPQQQKLIFGDFAWVIIVNLLISLLISLLFIPALLEQFSHRKSMVSTSWRRRRSALKFNRKYSAFISWGRRHRWVFIVVLILGFGVPIHKLPAQLKTEFGQEPTRWQKIYNKTIGGNFWQEHKAIPERAIGGAWRLFDVRKPSQPKPQGTDIERVTLTVRGGMVEGNTVHQLNDIVRQLENFLTQFNEIESFRTTVSGYDNSMITIAFKPEFEHGSFPYVLYEKIKREVNRLGGATWGIYGLPNLSFNNNISSYGQFKPHRITLRGYNYDALMGYAEALRDTLAKNRRVQEPGIFGEVSWGNDRRRQEFFVDIDREKIALTGSNLGAYFGQLGQLLYQSNMRPVLVDGQMRPTVLTSSQRESFDLWHVRNYPLLVDSARIKLSDFGTINREQTGLNIYKTNQAYQLIVAFDFIGSYELVDRLLTSEVERLNSEVLPIGFRAENDRGGWWGNDKEGGWKSLLLILLIIAIIYALCAILFESLDKPLIIILMIPVSFIGVFLTFGIFGFAFNEGGFASLVLLSGLVVNAGIYLINEYNIISRNLSQRKILRCAQNDSGLRRSAAKARFARRFHGHAAACPLNDAEQIASNGENAQLNIYMKAYSRKIIPILLTVISTVLGLIPFLIGKTDNFWRSFALGSMGGMIFSIIAFLIILPIFMKMKNKN